MRRVKRVKKSVASRDDRPHIKGIQFNIKKMLKEEGYSDQEIADLIEQERVLISVPRQGMATCPLRCELYVLDSTPEVDDSPPQIDRGYLIDLE